MWHGPSHFVSFPSTEPGLCTTADFLSVHTHRGKVAVRRYRLNWKKKVYWIAHPFLRGVLLLVSVWFKDALMLFKHKLKSEIAFKHIFDDTFSFLMTCMHLCQLLIGYFMTVWKLQSNFVHLFGWSCYMFQSNSMKSVDTNQPLCDCSCWYYLLHFILLMCPNLPLWQV